MGLNGRKMVELLVVLLLDAKAMPMLKRFQLVWGDSRLYLHYSQVHRGAENRGQFPQYFEKLSVKNCTVGCDFRRDIQERVL
jgi:hypothetical protein